MSGRLDVRVTSFRLAPPEMRADGLLGWICLSLNDRVLIDGIALRKSAEGRPLLAFPRRKDRNGVSHDIVRPLHATAREEIEAAVLAVVTRRGTG